MSVEVRTCSASLIAPGQCCMAHCDNEAVAAALDPNLIEHGVCDKHERDAYFIATKPMLWSDAWGPTCQ